MHWGTHSAAATGSRLRPSSTASIAGSPGGCMPTTPTPTKTFHALHGWRRCGKRSTAPRATPQNTISSENRWFSRCLGCLRKLCGNRSADSHYRQSRLSQKGIRGGEVYEKNCQEKFQEIEDREG